MKIEQIWRFPVKSMAGEQLDGARLTPLGIEGDRVVHVEDARGHLITSRTHPRLLGHHAKLNSSGQPVIDGILWSEPEIRKIAIDIAGPGAQLVWDESERRFDVLPLLVATDGALAAFGYDSRRLRPNLVIGGVKGLAERSWPGSCLRIGEVVIGVQDLRARCVMTTFDPDTLEQDQRVLREIARKFGGELALNCYVIKGREIHVGDRVQLFSGHEYEASRPM